MVAENKVGGLLIAFTSPQKRDKFNQYFNRSTDFGLELFGDSQVRPVDYHHNFGGIFGGIGHIRSIEVRDDGLYAEAELDIAHASYPFVREKVEAGELGWSAETMPNWMQVASDGHVSKFPIFAAALTGKASAPEGMTKVGILRGLGLEIEGNDDDDLPITLRSVWDVAEPAAPAPVARTTTTYQEALRSQPTSLPRPQLPSPASGGAAFNPNITHMRSAIDDIDLFKLMGWYALGSQSAHRKGVALNLPVEREQFMRGMLTRLVKLFNDDGGSAQPGFLRSTVFQDGNYTPSDWQVFAQSLQKPLGKLYSEPYHLRSDELMNSDLASGGDEWVYTGWTAMVHRYFQLETKVFGLFPAFNMPSNPYEHPVVASLGYARRVLETDDQADLTLAATPYPMRKLTTSKKTFTIKGKAGLITSWSHEFKKWSQIDVASEILMEHMRMMARTKDRMMLRGDETDTDVNISFYDTGSGTIPSVGASGVNDFLLLLDGLVHYSLVDATTYKIDANAVWATANVTAARALMGTLGLDPEGLVIITDHKLPYKMLETSDVKTVDVYGDKATLLKGEVGRLYNIPIVPSDQLGLVDADGRIHQTAGNNTELSFGLAHRNSIRIGIGWDTEVESGQAPFSDAEYLKSRTGFDQQVMEAGAFVYTYDITP